MARRRMTARPVAARRPETDTPCPHRHEWGTGACPEAQADGVPCEDPHRDCEVCQRARRSVRIRSSI
jgi:hypothetical protein